MRELSQQQSARYSRNIMLEEVGTVGQQKLLDAHVLIVGAGGLGCPVALYLAAAGVGTVGIADGDEVDLSNLQRQILHRTADIGRPKVESAKDQLAALNPDINIVTHHEHLTPDNITEVIKDYEIVVDATDNFPARFLINDVCIKAGKPWVHGGVSRFEGQLTTIIPGQGPCYRCLFHEPPPEGALPKSSEVGILGAVPGVVGSLQANEALKLILGKGDVLNGVLLTIDLLTMEFRKVRYRKNKECSTCGDNR
jgi:molybdopterin-synthase adenylyltransferase